MQSDWTSYLPHNIAAEILASPGASPLGREQRFEAVGLFADISGFTAMSEALARSGRTGAEELTALLNSYFEPTITRIDSYGGIVGRFGGDSLTVLFPCGSDRRETVRGALQCALDLQAGMKRYRAMPTSAGDFSLALRVGLAMGPLLCLSVGDPASRLEYLVAGAMLERCARAQAAAQPGEVAVDTELLPWLEPGEYRLEQGVARVTGLTSRHAGAPLPRLAAPQPEAIRMLAPYLHPTIRQFVEAGQLSLINEHRKVTIVFISFRGFDYDGDPQVGAKLQAYFQEVIRAVQRYNGYLKQIAVSDKGSEYLLLFGAPVAHENDAERALHCVLDLYRISAAHGLITQTGVNTGYVYCGQTGAPQRREYTALGDAVNLAARLMQAALPEQILVGEQTQRHAPRQFSWDELEPISVKGKAEPVRVYTLYELQQREAPSSAPGGYTLPMVGRDDLMGEINELLTRVLYRQGVALGINAQAGIGKTRLVAEVMRLAASKELSCQSGRCLSYGTGSSYLVWQELLAGLFGIDPTWHFQLQIQHLEGVLSELGPAYLQRMPLLSIALNLPIPESELTRSLDPGQRKASLEALLVDYLRYRAGEDNPQGTPLLLVLEDCQWIDPLSHDLLEALSATISDLPVLLLLTYRPPEIERFNLRIATLRHFHELELSELAPWQANRLVQLKLRQLYGSAEAQPALVDQIVERAQGNPFYIDEMLNLLHTRGIVPTDPAALQALELPDSVQSLVISRVDQLDEGPKTTLKVASVIGRSFKERWLWGAHPPLGGSKDVREHLATLSFLDLTAVKRSEPELECIFKHIMTREVTYASLSLATRTALHEQIGHFIETNYSQEIERYVDQLAYHFGQSQNREKQRIYFRRAGELAQAAYANAVAIDYYQRALPLMPPAEQVEVLIKLGQVRQLIGQWPEAEASFRQALALVEQEQAGPQQRSACQTALGILCYMRGSYAEALDWLGQARASAEGAGAQGQASIAVRYTGMTYLQQADYARALACFEQWRGLAQASQDQLGASQALANIGHVYFYQGEYRQALDCFEQWLHMAGELGDRRQIGATIGNMGIVYWYLGDPLHALECFERQLAIAAEIGDRRVISVACGNLAQVYYHHGEHERALAAYTRQLQLAVESGNRQQAAVAAGYSARVLMARGELELALRVYEQALGLARALKLGYYLCEFVLIGAELALRREDRPLARALCEEAAAGAEALKRKEIMLASALLRLRLRAAEEPAPALAAELERLAGEWPGEQEQAAIAYERWSLQGSQEQRERAAALYGALYARTPHAEYAERYQQLSGQAAPAAPELPSLPEIVTRRRGSMEQLLDRLDLLLDPTPPATTG